MGAGPSVASSVGCHLCVAAIISGGIRGAIISGVIPDATRGCVVRIGVFRGVLIAVRFFLHLLGQPLELLAARTAGLIVVGHVSL